MFSFCSLFETIQSLFWAVFGLVDLENFDLSGIKIFTRFWGMLMFGTYSVINIVVLLNLLIAMMNHSYQLISVSSCCICTRRGNLCHRIQFDAAYKFYHQWAEMFYNKSNSKTFITAHSVLMCSILVRGSNFVVVVKED